jgi:hypothetical protein
MSTVWALIVCLYGGVGTNAGAACVLLPNTFVSADECAKARDEVLRQRGWAATCVRQRSFP